MDSTWKISSVVSVLLLLLSTCFFTGCESSGGEVTPTPSTPNKLKPKLGVSISSEFKVDLPDGSTFYEVQAGQDISIEVMVQFCTLTDPAVENPEATSPCHYQTFMDTATESQYLSTGYQYIVNDGDYMETAHQAPIPRETILGTHLLIVRLYDHDGEYLGVQESVYVNVTEAPDDTTIAIVDPATGSVFQAGDTFELAVSVTAFEYIPFDDTYETTVCEESNGSLFCASNQPCEDGLCHDLKKGHYRVYLDDADGDDYIAMGADSNVSISLPADIGNGKHALRASLRFQDGTPYVTDDGGTDDVVVFYVEAPAETSVAILTPADGTVVVPGQTLNVESAVDGFVLLGEGEEAVDGELAGEIRYYLDGETDVALAVATNTYADVTLPAEMIAGEHLLIARLYNGEGDDLEISDSVSLIIPSLQIVTPEESSLFSPGAEVNLELEISGFTLEEPTGESDNQNGVGHFHVYLDDADDGDYLIMASTTEVTFALPDDIAEGLHTLRVSLRENDHAPLGVETTVGFAVGTGIPGVEFLSPADGKSVQPGGNILVNLQVENFGLVPIEEGKENAFGLGHYHLYLDNAADGLYLAAGHENPVSVGLPGLLTPGLHTLRVNLRNNDGSALGTEAEISLNVVTSGTPVVTIGAPLSGTPFADGSEVVVSLADLTDLTLTPITEDALNVAGEGHYRVYLDGAGGEEYVGACDTTDCAVVLPSGLTAGSHTLTVDLRNNDGTAIEGATDSVEIEIWDAPGLDVLAPANGNDYNPGENVDFNVAVSGITLVDGASSGENQVGEGSLRVYLDGATGDAFLAESIDESFSVALPTDLSAGMHILRVSVHNNDGSVTGTSTAVSVSIVSPALSVVSPIAGMQTFVAGSVMGVELAVDNFTLVEPGTGTGSASEGHIRVYLDGADGEDYVMGIDATETSFDVPLGIDIGYGDHLIRFSLRNDDGSAAGVDTEFFFLVAESGVSIDSPTSVGEVAIGGELTLELSFENFNLVEVVGGLAASPGEGHYHVYLDDADGGDYLLVSWENTAVITIPGNVVPGEHVLRVSLRNNDHTPVDPVSEVFLPVIITE